jgi:hypothetical protein
VGYGNDTNDEKALAFSDEGLFTVVGVWKGASDYRQYHKLGQDLYKLIVSREKGIRLTQFVSI